MNNSQQFTAHAARRCQQRAIPPFAVELVLDYGRVARRHGADCYYLDKRARKQIKRDLGRKIYSRLEDQLDIYVVEDGKVITAAHRTKRIKHNH